MVSAPKAIGLLGGTFDPVHNGHISIVQSFLNSSYLDKLIVFLTPEPPHKKNRKLTDFNQRREMLELALGSKENLLISTVEKELPSPSYTVNTINYFADKYPDAKIYLCIGEDSLVDLKNWFNWEIIIAKCTLLVAKRPDTMGQKIPQELEDHIRFIDHKPVNISSSDIRKSIACGEKVDDMLPPKVLTYINKLRLYQD